MKYILILLLFISGNANSQPSDYYPSGKYDTVTVQMLVALEDTSTFMFINNEWLNQSSVYVVKGYAVREFYVYHGDPMPPLEYSDLKQIKCFLGPDKRSLPDCFTVWDYRIIDEEFNRSIERYLKKNKVTWNPW